MWSFQASPCLESGAERVEGRSGGKQDTVSTKMIPRFVSEQLGTGRPLSQGEKTGRGSIKSQEVSFLHGLAFGNR